MFELPGTFIGKIRQHGYLIRLLAVRELRGRYVGSMLGIFWAVINPALLLLTYTIIFSGLMRIRPATGQPFAVWAFAGMLPWLFFNESLTRSLDSVSGRRALVTKTTLPPEILPFATLVAGLANHGIGVAIYLLILLVMGLVPGWAILTLPLYSLAAFLFSLGLGWILSALNVLARDIGQVIGVLLQLGFFATPIVYTVDLIPASLRWALAANPMATVVMGYRHALLGEAAPSGTALLVLLLICLVTVLAGGQVFRRLRPAFGDLL